MSDTTSLHIRISDEADAILELMVKSTGRKRGEIGAEIFNEALLGRGYRVKVAAEDYVRKTQRGSSRMGGEV